MNQHRPDGDDRTQPVQQQGQYPPPQGPPQAQYPPPQGAPQGAYPPPRGIPQGVSPPSLPYGQAAGQPVAAQAAPTGPQERSSRWAMGFAAAGTLTMVVSLFLNWFDVNFWITYVDEEGPLGDERELATPLTAVSVVRDVAGQDPDGADPGVFAQVFYPWLLVVLIIICCALAFAAAHGMRQPRRTTAVRVATVVAVLVAGALLYFSTFDLGVTHSPPSLSLDARSPVPGVGDAEVSSIRGYVDPYPGIAVPGVGALLLLIAGIIGPKVPRRRPAWGTPGPPMVPGPNGMAAPAGPAPATQHLPPGQVPAQHASPSGVPARAWLPTGSFQSTTQLAAVVVTGLAALLCLAGYLFLPWSKKVDFSDLSDAFREYGNGDKPITEAYFGWLGWVALVMVVAVAVVVALGRRPTGVNPRRLRPFLVGATGVAALLHVWVMIDTDGADFGNGAYAVALGLVLAVVGTALPLRTPSQPTGPTPWSGPVQGPQ